jgi:hypothetical protein
MIGYLLIRIALVLRLSERQSSSSRKCRQFWDLPKQEMVVAPLDERLQWVIKSLPAIKLLTG